MFQLNPKVFCDIKNGLRFSMFAVRKLPGLKLNSPALRQERNFRHAAIVAYFGPFRSDLIIGRVNSTLSIGLAMLA